MKPDKTDNDTDKQMTPLRLVIKRLQQYNEGQSKGDPSYLMIAGAIDYAASLLPKEKQMVIDAIIDATGGLLKQEHGEEYFNSNYQ